MLDRGNVLQLDAIQTLENPSTHGPDEPRTENEELQHSKRRTQLQQLGQALHTKRPLEFFKWRLDEE